jgi:SAM-dependent methyltransferase
MLENDATRPPDSSAGAACWCGQTALAPCAHAAYRCCPSCGTACLRPEHWSKGLSTVGRDDDHLYGKQYWYEHQQALGLPPIDERARLDFIERCQYWLSYVLKYRLPPGRALEIGCAHGGFVKLLQLAGFDARGMEISPAIVRDAAARFGIDVLQGPIEAGALAEERFDLIAAFDVLEHLPNPPATLAEVARHLKADGLLAIQTPRHDAIADRNWPMYLPPEHTFLYSSEGLRKLLASVELSHVRFEPALFPYDMFVFASRRPLTVNDPAAIASCLSASPGGRIALALQDLFHLINRERALDPAERFGTRKLGRALLKSLRRSFWRRLGR